MSFPASQKGFDMLPRGGCYWNPPMVDMFAAFVTEQDVSEFNRGTTSKAVTDKLRAAVEPIGNCQATVPRFKKRNAEADALGKRITRNVMTATVEFYDIQQSELR
ncbi:hypothetical protein E4U54_000127 [Claviceps lovelessii]|nr:hypothetical protein E4U54_000127 [Claviceps lovelessii]